MISMATTQAGNAADRVWHQGQNPPLSLAHAHGHALGQLLALMQLQESASAGDAADACLCAFVNSRLHMADALAEQSDADAAAICLAQTHQTLLAMIYQTRLADAWQKSAIWHSRRLHCALLNHLEEFGHHPAIDAAFRAGCLVLSVPSGQLH